MTLVVAGVLLPVALSWVAVPGWQARTHLLAAAALVEQMQLQLENGEQPAARQTLAALQRQTTAARDQTAGLSWRVGQRVPGLAENLAAVSTVAVAMDDLDPAALAPRDGRVELAPLQRAAPRIAVADQAVRVAQDRVAAIRTGRLLPPLRSAIAHLRQRLDRSAATVGTAARTAQLAPPMLGADGPRTYLALFQNPAEVRATGGIPGAFAVVRADRGVLRTIEQGTAAVDLQTFGSPVLPLDPAMRELYTERLGTYPANVNLTPHFPTTAKLAREMYRRRSGRTVDGVLATDPVVLSYLLRATGPVGLPDGTTLTADNAVRVLLSDVYDKVTSASAQDEYFATAATAAFDTLVGGGAVPATAIDELARAAGERRTLLWSAHPAEQRLIAGTVLAGELPTDDGLRSTVGVFLNDGGGAKLGYYLTQQAQLRVVGCRTDGRRELRLRVTLGSTAPDRGLSRSVLGLGLAGDRYTIRTNVSIFSPAGGSLVEVRRDGLPVPVGTGTERGRAVGVLTVDLLPGASVTVEATVLTGELPAGRAVSANLWMTPAVTAWDKKVQSPTVCGT